MTRSCFRRWYVFFPLLLAVTWFSYSVYSSVKPVFYANTTLGFASPSLRIDNTPQGVPVPRNGLLDVGGAPLIANMTAIGLRAPSVYERVVTAGGVPYTTKMFPTPAGMLQLPMIMVEVTAADPAQVLTTLALVTNEADLTLRGLQRQADVPDGQMVESFVVAPPSTPTAAMPSRTRSTIVVFGGGVGLSILLTVVVDALLSRRRARVQRREQAQADAVAKPALTQVTNNSRVHAAEDTVEAT